MTKLATNLTAVVTYERTEGKLKFITHIAIKVGNLTAATATLGGRYSQNQAVTEFRKNQSRFKLAPWFTPAYLKLAA
jgi:hypothetical protein